MTNEHIHMQATAELAEYRSSKGVMASPPSAPSPKAHHSADYYYFFAAVASIAVMLLVANVIAVGCCAPSGIIRAIRRFLGLRGEGDSCESKIVIPLRKYQKGKEEDEPECSVCLMVFVDGEDVRQLPKCKHSFHAPCIDMWLYSHSNCPLCRTDIFTSSSAPCHSIQIGEGSTPRRPAMESRAMANV